MLTPFRLTVPPRRQIRALDIPYSLYKQAFGNSIKPPIWDILCEKIREPVARTTWDFFGEELWHLIADAIDYDFY